MTLGLIVRGLVPLIFVAAFSLAPLTVFSQPAKGQLPIGSPAGQPAPLNTYEADVGDFHVKLESGVAKKGLTGYFLSGGKVAVWLKDHPSKRITIESGTVEVQTSGERPVAIKVNTAKVAAELLPGPPQLPRIIDKAEINTKTNAEELSVSGFLSVFGLEFPVDLSIRSESSGVKLIGGGSVGKKTPGTVTSAGGYQISCLDRQAILSIQDAIQASFLCREWQITSPDGKTSTVKSDPHTSGTTVSADGMVPVPLPTGLADAVDLDRSLRDGCIEAAKKISEAAARDVALKACSVTYPPPTLPKLPANVSKKLADLMK